MKILDILRESFRTERIDQHNKANRLRSLYKERDVLKTAARDAMGGRRSEEAYDKLIDELDAVEIEIEMLEKGLNENFDDAAIERVKAAIARGEPKLKEMEEDLHFMANAAQTEEEHDAVDDFKVSVDRQRRVLDRLKQSLKLRMSANQFRM